MSQVLHLESKAYDPFLASPDMPSEPVDPVDRS